MVPAIKCISLSHTQNIEVAVSGVSNERKQTHIMARDVYDNFWKMCDILHRGDK